MRLCIVAHIANALAEGLGCFMVYNMLVPQMVRAPRANAHSLTPSAARAQSEVYAHSPAARRLLQPIAVLAMGTACVTSVSALLLRETHSFASLATLLYYHFVNLLFFAGPAFHNVAFHELSEPRVAFAVHVGVFALVTAAWLDLFEAEAHDKKAL
jgi:hypothetical protein